MIFMCIRVYFKINRGHHIVLLVFPAELDSERDIKRARRIERERARLGLSKIS